MSLTFEKLSNPTLRGRIAERIRDAILDGSLPEGERLVERRLAAEFGASLTAVREALIELETDGFIQKLPNSSTHVIQLSVEDGEKITSVREVLEGFAAAEAAQTASVAEVETLMAINADVMRAAEAGDVRRCLQKDLLLHETMWAIPGNEHLVASLRRVVLPCYAFLTIRMRSRSLQDLSECAEANLVFLSAIHAKDAKGASAAMRFALRRWFERAIGPAPSPSR